MTHPPGSPPSDPGTGDGSTGPGRILTRTLLFGLVLLTALAVLS